MVGKKMLRTRTTTCTQRPLTVVRNRVQCNMVVKHPLMRGDGRDQ